jgi:hypothetical protein
MRSAPTNQGSQGAFGPGFVWRGQFADEWNRHVDRAAAGDPRLRPVWRRTEQGQYSIVVRRAGRGYRGVAAVPRPAERLFEETPSDAQPLESVRHTYADLHDTASGIEQACMTDDFLARGVIQNSDQTFVVHVIQRAECARGPAADAARGAQKARVTRILGKLTVKPREILIIARPDAANQNLHSCTMTRFAAWTQGRSAPWEGHLDRSRWPARRLRCSE